MAGCGMNMVLFVHSYKFISPGLERVLEELMGESAFLKVRSDLYPSPGGEHSPRPTPDHALPPQDWDPAAPCFVCLGTSHAATQVSHVCAIPRRHAKLVCLLSATLGITI